MSFETIESAPVLESSVLATAANIAVLLLTVAVVAYFIPKLARGWEKKPA